MTPVADRSTHTNSPVNITLINSIINYTHIYVTSTIFLHLDSGWHFKGGRQSNYEGAQLSYSVVSGPRPRPEFRVCLEGNPKYP